MAALSWMYAIGILVHGYREYVSARGDGGREATYYR